MSKILIVLSSLQCFFFGREHIVYLFITRMLCSFRGFNDAISGFNDDGWSVMGGDGIEDVIIACNSKKIKNSSNPASAFGAPGGIICAKASMLLQVRVQQFHIN